MINKAGYILALLVTAFSFQACETSILNDEASSQQKKAQNYFEVGEEFVLNFDSEAKNKAHGISVIFISVEDYRCPADVRCFWAGNGEIKLILTIGDNSRNIALNTHNKYQKSITIQDYKVQLLSLNPYPQSSENLPAEGKYKATLIIK